MKVLELSLVLLAAAGLTIWRALAIYHRTFHRQRPSVGRD
jgi:hypothetical protein